MRLQEGFSGFLKHTCKVVTTTIVLTDESSTPPLKSPKNRS